MVMVLMVVIMMIIIMVIVIMVIIFILTKAHILIVQCLYLIDASPVSWCRLASSNSWNRAAVSAVN